MSNFTFEKTPIEGLVVITPKVFGDDRGYFMETYREKEFIEGGVNAKFVQDNQSRSKKGVLRGLHFQINYPQDKLVRVVSGEVFDVAACGMHKEVDNILGAELFHLEGYAFKQHVCTKRF